MIRATPSLTKVHYLLFIKMITLEKLLLKMSRKEGAMNRFNETISFYTKSKNYVQLNITENGVIAILDKRNVGSVTEGVEQGYSLNSMHSVLRQGKFVRHIIIPQKADQLRVKGFFVGAKVVITRKKREQQERLIERLSNLKRR